MKTRQELQKEIDYLVSVLKAKDEDNLQMDAERHHLKSELEVANNHVQHFQNQILEMVKEQKEKEIEVKELEIEREYCRLSIKEIKSKSLFQLIRWWYNAKN